MSQSLALLRLLEPAVKPVGGAATPAASAVPPPFESQRFEDLLSSASTGEPTGLPVGDAADAPPDDPPVDSSAAADRGPLGPLADFSRIENPGLRQLLADARSAPPAAA